MSSQLLVKLSVAESNADKVRRFGLSLRVRIKPIRLESEASGTSIFFDVSGFEEFLHEAGLP